ncbi:MULTISPECIES: HAD-IA family hydrolase [unclassified Rhodococcus (in: high G+C Gram-positive bacteria)]|uniref:HAD-IA family hydrolase n=1 Tax=unclassified Rhodococcus (in: high G+C Gram-positive bacteria) TaxID=192944 RepID=UPI000E0ADB38|nr:MULTISPECIES: HAD-IA family hydrolase [unclassified Rhodococcus (in: high G+C Gram-positive bacteria)]QKT12533.1 HAD-IA family hydrolase [Rhodococcus sp. W8901]RDI25770.1 HAD superfamily hydrolase (TIGR01509 family) [Rhodococcus sp. AG1013]
MRGLVLDFGGVLAGPGADADLMARVVGDARRRGIRTAILSNDPGGPGAQGLRDLAGPFVDEVVLSGDVGMAKPNRRIYELTAARLGLDPLECVFVDDLVGNVRAAAAAGMVGVHHVDPSAAVEEIAILLDSGIRPESDGGDPAGEDLRGRGR